VATLVSSIATAVVWSCLSPSRFWAVWETTGIAFTAFYSVSMWPIWFVGKDADNEPPVNKMLESKASGIFIGCTLGVAALLVLTAWMSWNQWPPVLHSFFLIVVSGLSVAAQKQVRDYPNATYREHKAYRAVQNEASNTIRYSDVPTLITFTALWIFVLIGSMSSIATNEIKSFVAGSVSFQLLLSNIAFGMNYALPRENDGTTS
jgi:hypothetical protein